MHTTIPVDKTTKTRLFKLKNRLELEEGRPISYTELVQILIQNMEREHSCSQLSEFKQFQGILRKKTKETFDQEREIDVAAEETHASKISSGKHRTD